MKRLLVILAILTAATAAQAQDSLIVLPWGDTATAFTPTPMPTDVDSVEGFIALVNWWFILLVLIVGYLKPYIPLLRNVGSKELALLAFVVAALLTIVVFKDAFGEGATIVDVLRVIVNAAIATRIYAWGIKPITLFIQNMRATNADE